MIRDKCEEPLTLDAFNKEIGFETDLYDDLAVEVSCERANRGLTQTNLAEVMDTKQSVISRFENMGRKPSLRFLEKVSKALGHRLYVSIYGEYHAPLTQEFIDKVDCISEATQMRKEDVVRDLRDSSLNCLTDKIKWYHIAAKTTSSEEGESIPAVTLHLQGFTKKHYEQRAYA